MGRQRAVFAVRTMMETIIGSEERTLDELILAERRAVEACMGSPDATEGMRAFLEKRNPVFNRS
jgi:enoyl-CoA hydratase